MEKYSDRLTIILKGSLLSREKTMTDLAVLKIEHGATKILVKLELTFFKCHCFALMLTFYVF